MDFPSCLIGFILTACFALVIKYLGKFLTIFLILPYAKEAIYKRQNSIFNLRILVFCPTIYLTTVKVYTKFEDFGSHRCREICDRNFYWRERKWTNKENDIKEEADSLLRNTTNYTQHCTKFQNPRRSRYWEIFDTNCPLYYMGVRDGKKENGIRW